MREIQYEIVKEIAVLSTGDSGYTKEINLISWNGKEPKYDIRSFSPNREKCGKGITLNADEAAALLKAGLMVSDWQGGDISKLFPALSGKEDLSMGEDKKADKKRKRIVPKAPVQMIISREYVGTQTVTEAFVPIISEDIRKKIAEGDTFDNEGLSA
mgnify:CR=1 FL=1